MYPKILQFNAVIQESYSISLARNSFLPMIVTRGSNQVAISSKFEVRDDPSIICNYGDILIEFSKITPDGLVAFFPSYLYMESIISQWHTLGILDEIWKYKLILVETPDSQETVLALKTYRTVIFIIYYYILLILLIFRHAIMVEELFYYVWLEEKFQKALILIIIMVVL